MSTVNLVSRATGAVLFVLLASCQPGSEPPSTVSAPAATPPAPARTLTIDILYPKVDTSVEMGGRMSVIARASNPDGSWLNGAVALIRARDPQGRLMVEMRMKPGRDGVYRASSFLIPSRTTAGRWRVEVEITSGTDAGSASAGFRVQPSISEHLLQEYGFWIGAPSLGSINPFLAAERGDAQNGLIRWGGQIPASHVFPEAWLEVQWRAGLADLSDPAAVRRFLLDDLGDFGFTPVRAIGDITPMTFQARPAWKVIMRGQFYYDNIQWVVFNAAQVDKTYAIGTTVVLPPQGIDPHAWLRDTFELPPGIQAHGTAPEALPDLLPGPTLLAPELGARFTGGAANIVLSWASTKVLTADEVYQIDLSTNYDEGSPGLSLTTQATHLKVPASLYHQPNCGVFNWQVRLMRQVGTSSDGRPELEAESHTSLYAYFLWSRPLGEPAEFLPLCPNAQY